MDRFSFSLPETNLLFGKGTLSELGARTRRHGRKALLVVGKGSMRKFGFLQKAETSLEDAGVSVVIFEGVESNPTVRTVQAGITLGLKESCDVVVALGGGSSIDAAKSIAVGIGHRDKDAWAYICGDKETTQNTLPIVAVPSTSGTGSHLTWYTVITNEKTGEKAAYSSRYIFPIESIVDLRIVSKMPPKVTAETGFDALAHVMESYMSSGASPITDLLCLRAMELISQNLPRAYENGNDVDARYAMALADTYAGICITPARTIMVHGMGNTVSGVYPNISHGQALACLTGPIMKFNIERCDSKAVTRYCDIARALGEEVEQDDKKNALKSVEAVEKLLRVIGMTTKMSKCGVSEGSIERMTDYSLRFGAGAISCNPVKPTRSDVVRIYQEAL